MAMGSDTTASSVRIVGFLCNWCSYAGADMAGTARMKQPASVRVVRLPCSGRVNPLLILKAFQEGADGVLVSGCHPGDCHYNDGNYYARRRLEVLKRMLATMGVDEDRFHYTWVSATEGARWTDVVWEFTEKIEQLGPMKRAEGEEATEDMGAVAGDSGCSTGCS